MEETYQAYINRVAQLTIPSHYQTQLQNIQRSPKFDHGQPVSFPGYSIISPPQHEDRNNATFYQELGATQQQLVESLESDLMIPVSRESFHLTLADLIWDGSYKAAIREHADFEQQLQNQVKQSFAQYSSSPRMPSGSHWQLLGITIRPRAIEVCLVPQDEPSYQNIVQLRRALYQNGGLIGLGIEQQYNFSAHVTLGYFGKITDSLDRERLTQILVTVNDRWLDAEPPILSVERAELRKFDNMMHYFRRPNWPVIAL